ncbi:hypothetical protein Plim_0965 [Planctopirus limnophila DSM 3776]|uniref:Uncharacterized protein n=1 Tax=Planctopirus limnophila (strain ATCC 43296 / DSM 3776 / IFAM 1008 / Mu 290) TaxID=521674 RepID=D5ST41_PLAL2|nr:hypothetical protein Plim_0965 [Planctopirus limnophila DSM 3776]
MNATEPSGEREPAGWPRRGFARLGDDSHKKLLKQQRVRDSFEFVAAARGEEKPAQRGRVPKPKKFGS